MRKSSTKLKILFVRLLTFNFSPIAFCLLLSAFFLLSSSAFPRRGLRRDPCPTRRVSLRQPAHHSRYNLERLHLCSCRRRGPGRESGHFDPLSVRHGQGARACTAACRDA